MAKTAPLVNEDRINAQRRREKSQSAVNDDDLRTLMATPAGRRFLYRLVYDICGVENGIWSPSAEIHYLEGQRAVGIKLKNEAQRAAPEQYILMVQEKIQANAEEIIVHKAIIEGDG